MSSTTKSGKKAASGTILDKAIATGTVFNVSQYIEKEEVISFDKLKIDPLKPNEQYGQVRPIEEDHVQELMLDFASNPPSQIALTVWNNVGMKLFFTENMQTSFSIPSARGDFYILAGQHQYSAASRIREECTLKGAPAPEWATHFKCKIIRNNVDLETRRKIAGAEQSRQSSVRSQRLSQVADLFRQEMARDAEQAAKEGRNKKSKSELLRTVYTVSGRSPSTDGSMVCLFPSVLAWTFCINELTSYQICDQVTRNRYIPKRSLPKICNCQYFMHKK